MAVAVIQRPLRGSRIASFYPVKSLPALSSLDSAFQLQEYISLLIRLDVHDVETIVSIPGKSTPHASVSSDQEVKLGVEGNNESDVGEDTKLQEDKEGGDTRKAEILVDRACWIYEQLRRLAQDLTHPLITMLQQECTRTTCPEMKAGEWLYLCVAHGTDGAMESCCAIDYILHTLDSATALLNSPRTFPSRLQIPASSHRHFSSLARRLGRIFAHAYFHHREAFEQAEAESSLYARFLALTSKFDLVPSEFLVIPPKFGHHDGGGGEDLDRMGRDSRPPRLLSASAQPEHSLGSPEQSRGHPVELATNAPPPFGRRTIGGPPGLGIETAIPPPDTTTTTTSSTNNESGNDSPRKFGRSRTDTMVLSDVSFIAEELSKSDFNDNNNSNNDNDNEGPLLEPTAFSSSSPEHDDDDFRILQREAPTRSLEIPSIPDVPVGSVAIQPAAEAEAVTVIDLPADGTTYDASFIPPQSDPFSSQPTDESPKDEDKMDTSQVLVTPSSSTALADPEPELELVPVNAETPPVAKEVEEELGEETAELNVADKHQDKNNQEEEIEEEEKLPTPPPPPVEAEETAKPSIEASEASTTTDNSLAAPTATVVESEPESGSETQVMEGPSPASEPGPEAPASSAIPLDTSVAKVEPEVTPVAEELSVSANDGSNDHTTTKSEDDARVSGSTGGGGEGAVDTNASNAGEEVVEMKE